MESITSPMDFIKPYKDSGFAAIIWKNPSGSDDSRQLEFVKKLEEKGFKVQTLTMPELPPGYPSPLYYPELTFSILNSSDAEAIITIVSGFLDDTYRDVTKITIKIDILLEKRIISVEANGSSDEVSKTIKNLHKIEKLVTSNLIMIVADQELTKIPQKFCSKCGVTITTQSEYCFNCGEKQ